jgi:hypothetical protein
MEPDKETKGATTATRPKEGTEPSQTKTTQQRTKPNDDTSHNESILNDLPDLEDSDSMQE